MTNIVNFRAAATIDVILCEYFPNQTRLNSKNSQKYSICINKQQCQHQIRGLSLERGVYSFQIQSVVEFHINP
jgi:hypothetical protein